MSTSSESTSRAQIERQISRRLRRVVPTDDLSRYEVAVLVQMGYERESLLRLESHHKHSDYDQYTLRRLSLHSGQSSGQTPDDLLISLLSAYREHKISLHELLDAADPKCTPSLIAQMLSAIAIASNSGDVAQDDIHQIRTLAEQVRLKKVHSATCEAMVGIAMIERRCGNHEHANRALFDARAHALSCSPWVALANAAIYQSIADIDARHNRNLVTKWEQCAGVVSLHLPRLRDLLVMPSTFFRPRAATEFRDNTELLGYVSSIRHKAASFLYSYAHDALVSTDELSVASSATEISKIASDMTHKRTAMLTLIEELDKSLTQLANERIRISAISSERRSLLTLASHEIKNPLLSISLLASRYIDDESVVQRERYRQEIVHQIDTLEYEIHAYLLDGDHRRSEIFHRNSRCDLSAVLEEEIRAMRIQIKERSQTVIVDAPPGLITTISETAARVLIRNVLSNALRHSEMSTPINITIQQRVDAVVLVIGNTVRQSESAADPYSSGKGREMIDMVLQTIGATWNTQSNAQTYTVTIVLPNISQGATGEERPDKSH